MQSELHFVTRFGMFLQFHQHEVIAIRLEPDLAAGRNDELIDHSHPLNLLTIQLLPGCDHQRSRFRDWRAGARQAQCLLRAVHQGHISHAVAR